MFLTKCQTFCFSLIVLTQMLLYYVLNHNFLLILSVLCRTRCLTTWAAMMTCWGWTCYQSACPSALPSTLPASRPHRSLYRQVGGLNKPRLTHHGKIMPLFWKNDVAMMLFWNNIDFITPFRVSWGTREHRCLGHHRMEILQSCTKLLRIYYQAFFSDKS